MFFLAQLEDRRIAFRRIWFGQWRVPQRLQTCAGEAQTGDGGEFGSLQRESMREKRRAWTQRIANAARDTRQVEKRSAPPEIGTQVDGKIIVIAPELPRRAHQQDIGRKRVL